MDYFIPVAIDTTVESAIKYQEGGSSAVLQGVIKPTTINVAKDGIKHLGNKGVITLLKKQFGLQPHRGQKKVVSWGVSGLMSGVEYRLTQDNSPNWFSTFLLKKWLPSFVQKQVVSFAYKAAVNATGADYPEFIKNRGWLHHTAQVLIPTYVTLGLSILYGMGLNYLTSK